MELTNKMREAISNGEAILYHARDGREWFISEGASGYVANNGTILQFGYPSLSICQEAIEANSIYWKGKGWYRPIAFNWEDELLWCETPEEVKELEESMKRRFGERPSGVEFVGGEKE